MDDRFRVGTQFSSYEEVAWSDGLDSISGIAGGS